MTQEYTLRAMATNYAGGHCWDHLDGETCTKAADEIKDLRQGRPEWRCFHCDEVFTDEAAAKDHFGYDYAEPGCKLNEIEGGLLGILRRQEERLDACHREDTASYREFYALGADHYRAIRSEEEKGYARGLRDANAEFLDLVGRISDYFHVNAKPTNDLALGYMRELDEIITRRAPLVSSTVRKAPKSCPHCIDETDCASVDICNTVADSSWSNPGAIGASKEAGGIAGFATVASASNPSSTESKSVGKP